jgi:tRNA G10  N-methylase Trm11
VTVDIREETEPTVVADVRALPFASASFDWIMADPPYANSYAEMLYGTGAKYMRPTHILNAAARVLRPGGRIGLLHYLVPMPDVRRHGLQLERVYGVYTGPSQAIRAWSVWQKPQPELFA